MAEIITTFAAVGNTIAGNFLDFHGITSGGLRGFAAPFIGQVSRVSINRSDVDACLINILVNGAVQAQIPTSALTVCETLVTPVPFSECDVISVQNDATGNNISNVSVNLFMQDTVEIPSALSVRDLYRFNIFGHYINGLISIHGADTLGDGATGRTTIARAKFIDEIVDYLMSTRP
jgi:hypothetical protein